MTDYHFIETLLNGKVLNVEDGIPTAGARIILWQKEYPPQPNELFTLQDASQVGHSGYFYIASAMAPNMVLDVEGGEAYPGARLVLFPMQYPPAPNQLFQWRDQAIGCMLGEDNMVLDIEGGQGEDGAGVVLFPRKDYDNQNQNWQITYA